jgi:hypothetical protein
VGWLYPIRRNVAELQLAVNRAKDQLYTIVDDKFKMEIRLAAARCGSIASLAAAMGINERRIRTVLCQDIVSEDWMERFCNQAPTEVWITDFEWYPFAEALLAAAARYSS